MQLIEGVQLAPVKTVLYGPEGIGKSTFAARFPGVVFCDTEGSTRRLDVRRTPRPTSYTMLLEQVRYFIRHPGMLQTFALDTADWAEKLCMEELCAKYQKKGIEDFGYGKGYVYLQEEFGRLLNLLEELIAQNIHVVVTAHAKMRKFEQPDEMGAYDRWELKLQKTTAPMLKEWADMVLFANYKTYVINVDGQGADKGKNKVQGGRRVMYAAHHPCWDAKNRFGLPEELPFDFSAVAQVIGPHAQATPTEPPESQQECATDMPAGKNFPAPPHAEQPSLLPDMPAVPVVSALEPPAPEERGIPKPLLDLMRQNGVQPEEIQFVVAKRGYYPNDTPIDRYDPAFIKGVLIGAWPQVMAMVQKERDNTPF